MKLVPNHQELLRYPLLHNFFLRSKHKRKINVEPLLEDNNLVARLRKHHEKIQDSFISAFQYYDQWASRITRKIPSPTTSRYTWQAKKMRDKIDFTQLATKIKEVSKNIWILYSFIYHSKELKLVVESMNHGHNTLHRHLIVIANLMVQALILNNE